jgi:DNA-nicking Smr family endonuclease
MGADDENDDEGRTEDGRAWQEETRDVRRLKKDPGPELPPKKPVRRRVPAGSAAVSEETVLPPPRVKPGSNSIDKRTAEKLKRGEMPLEGRLDLHGKTQDEALRALSRFIRAAYGAGKRCVLVITGKGGKGGEGGPGILQSRVPEWLADASLAPMVLRSQKAQQKDGGAGALYVLLRRKRN